MSVETTGPGQKAIELFREQGGTLRTSEALRQGIHPRTLYALRDAGVLEQLSRGLYRLSEMPPLAHPDLVTVSRRVPRAVICLLSALDFYELTTQIPHAVHIALESKTEAPRLDYPPLRVFWFSGSAWSAGIETHTLDGVPVRTYGPAKSVADLFKYRNKIGQDVALEALRLYRRHPAFDVGELLRYARVCRVENVLRPYLEALL
jgi:predicted transcriptional regulator of viral defense system